MIVKDNKRLKREIAKDNKRLRSKIVNAFIYWLFRKSGLTFCLYRTIQESKDSFVILLWHLRDIALVPIFYLTIWHTLLMWSASGRAVLPSPTPRGNGHLFLTLSWMGQDMNH